MATFEQSWWVVRGGLIIAGSESADPTTILLEAQASLRRDLEQEKERAVQIITARDGLRRELAVQQEVIAALERQVFRAGSGPDEELVRSLLLEKDAREQNVKSLMELLAQIEARIEARKRRIKRLERETRRRAALRLHAWRATHGGSASSE